MAPVIAGADRTAEMVTPASAGVVIPETVMHYDSLGAIAGDYTLTPPAGDVWRILSVKFIFFAAGAAGNRVLNVAFDYGLGSTLMWMSGNQVLHGAGVAGNRYLNVELRNASSQIIVQLAQPVVQTASLTRRYYFQLSGATSTAFWAWGGAGPVQLSHPLPEHYVEAGGSLRVVVLGNQAGDAFASFSASIQKWRV